MDQCSVDRRRGEFSSLLDTPAGQHDLLSLIPGLRSLDSMFDLIGPRLAGTTNMRKSFVPSFARGH